MELFISLHTLKFKDSYWTQQEIGFAVAKGIKIIAVRMDEDPTGFLSKYQALSRNSKNAEQLAADIDNLVKQDERLRIRYSEVSSEDDSPF
jgi:nucleoside 2-deoxyribosyltransferase